MDRTAILVINHDTTCIKWHEKIASNYEITNQIRPKKVVYKSLECILVCYSDDAEFKLENYVIFNSK